MRGHSRLRKPFRLYHRALWLLGRLLASEAQTMQHAAYMIVVVLNLEPLPDNFGNARVVHRSVGYPAAALIGDDFPKFLLLLGSFDIQEHAVEGLEGSLNSHEHCLPTLMDVLATPSISAISVAVFPRPAAQSICVVDSLVPLPYQLVA